MPLVSFLVNSWHHREMGALSEQHQHQLPASYSRTGATKPPRTLNWLLCPWGAAAIPAPAPGEKNRWAAANTCVVNLANSRHGEIIYVTNAPPPPPRASTPGELPVKDKQIARECTQVSCAALSSALDKGIMRHQIAAQHTLQTKIWPLRLCRAMQITTRKRGGCRSFVGSAPRMLPVIHIEWCNDSECTKIQT